MEISEKDKIVLEVLKEEKRLVSQEQLQLVQTSKQTIALLIPLLGLSLDLASRIPETYLLIPFVICAFGFFLLSSQNTHNVVCGYKDRLDQEIIKTAKMDFPLYQMSMGEAMADWKFNISSRFGYFLPHPYYLLGIATAAVVIPIYTYSVMKGHRLLNTNHFYWFDVAFDVVCIIAFAVLVYSFIVFPSKFKEFRQTTIEKRFNDLLFQKNK